MFVEILIGFIVGILIGLTGIGGGALMMPLLLLIGIPPLIAIGTNLIFNFVTKAWSVFLHYTRKINWKIVGFLFIGIILANFIAFFIIKSVKIIFLFYLIISILILGSLYNIIRFIMKKDRHIFYAINSSITYIFFGFIVALLVSLTSIGAGLILTFLLIHFTKLNEKEIVKITLIFGFLATFFGSILHGTLGNINYKLAALLIIGSIPGSYFGYLLHNKVDYKKLRLVLAVMILVVSFILGIKYILT